MTRAAAVLAFFALASCGGSGPADALRFESAQGSYVVTLVPSPSPIPLNRPFEATLRVEAKKGPAVELGVEVDARMPEHFHGMNTVAKTARQADGSFKTEGLLFHMPGRWELYVDITAGGKTERAQVEVNLK